MNEKFSIYVVNIRDGCWHAAMCGMGGDVLGVAVNKASKIEAMACAFNEAGRSGSYLIGNPTVRQPAAIEGRLLKEAEA